MESLNEGGRAAVSTRRVAAAAGVQTPTIYRLFGDMQGLLDAVASHGFDDYLARSPIPEGPIDALEELRHGWDMHVDFGLQNPAIYTLMYGSPVPGVQRNFMSSTHDVLRRRVENVARAGRLQVSVDVGVRMVESVGTGVVLTLIGLAPAERDPNLSATCREMTIEAMTNAVPVPTGGTPVRDSAVTLQASLDTLVDDLTPGELSLLSELLARIATKTR